MPRFLFALAVLAPGSTAQFPALGLYQPRQRTPTLQLVQSATTTLSPAQAALRLRTLGGPQPPDQSACRVLPTFTPWVEQRTMPPADQEPTTIRVEACVPVLVEEAMEAMGGFLPPWTDVTGKAIRVRGAFDASFGVPIFDVLVPLADMHVVRNVPADGIDDFAGFSGGVDAQSVALLQVNDFTVAPFGAFFTQPGGYVVFLEASIDGTALLFVHHGGAWHFQDRNFAAAGVSITHMP